MPAVFLPLRTGAELGQCRHCLRIVPRDDEERHWNLGIALRNPGRQSDLGPQPRLDVAGERDAAVFQRRVELLRELLVCAGVRETVHRAEQVHLLRHRGVEVGHRVDVDRGRHHLLDGCPRRKDDHQGGRRGSANHDEPRGWNQQAPIPSKP